MPPSAATLIPPERPIRPSLIPILLPVRSERQLMEQMHYSCLFLWFEGLGIGVQVSTG